MKRRAQSEAAEGEDTDTLIMSIRLKSGRFESSIEIPLFATEGEKKEFIEQWLILMGAGLKCGQQHRKQKKENTA